MSAVGRRQALAAAGATLALAAAGPARALGRTPVGGSIALTLPWSIDALDPHDAHDAIGALFAHAAFDALYATTDGGLVHPALAAALPERDGAGVAVKLRPGLRTAAGRALDARDVVASLQRARARGAGPLLAPQGEVRPAAGDPLAVVLPRADAAEVARALASPLAAIVPRSFDARRPDGTGAFAVRLADGDLELTRNGRAARGASFLDRVTVRRGADLRAGLRAFEIGEDDVGWLGAGLFGRRPGATRFDLGTAALVALLVGERLGAHARPGGAQALCDGIPRDRLAHLALGDRPAGEPAARWTGDPVDLCVEAGAPHLLEIARAVASSLGAPGHEVVPRVLPRRDVIARGRRDALALVVVRPPWPGPDGALMALTALEDPARASRPPPGRPQREGSARGVTGALRVGVLGDVRVSGAAARGVVLAAHPAGGWDLGASHRRIL